MEGGCLCGAVRFAFDGRPTPIQLCHARRCQRASGAPFLPEIAVPVEGFRWLRGEDALSVWDAPLLREPPPYRRVFCRTCGSPAPVVREDMPWVLLPAGILDEDPGTRPFRHVFLSHSPAWYAVPPDELARFDERPPADQRLPRRRGGG